MHPHLFPQRSLATEWMWLRLNSQSGPYLFGDLGWGDGYMLLGGQIVVFPRTGLWALGVRHLPAVTPVWEGIGWRPSATSLFTTWRKTVRQEAELGPAGLRADGAVEPWQHCLHFWTCFAWNQIYTWPSHVHEPIKPLFILVNLSCYLMVVFQVATNFSNNPLKPSPCEFRQTITCLAVT